MKSKEEGYKKKLIIYMSFLLNILFAWGCDFAEELDLMSLYTLNGICIMVVLLIIDSWGDVKRFATFLVSYGVFFVGNELFSMYKRELFSDSDIISEAIIWVMFSGIILGILFTVSIIPVVIRNLQRRLEDVDVQSGKAKVTVGSTMCGLANTGFISCVIFQFAYTFYKQMGKLYQSKISYVIWILVSGISVFLFFFVVRNLISEKRRFWRGLIVSLGVVGGIGCFVFFGWKEKVGIRYVDVSACDEDYQSEAMSWAKENADLFQKIHISEGSYYLVYQERDCGQIAERLHGEIKAQVVRFNEKHEGYYQAYYDEEQFCMRRYSVDEDDEQFMMITSAEISSNIKRNIDPEESDYMVGLVYLFRKFQDEITYREKEYDDFISSYAVKTHISEGVTILNQDNTVSDGDLLTSGSQVEIHYGELDEGEKYFLNGKVVENVRDAKVEVGYEELCVDIAKSGEYFSGDVRALKEFALQYDNNKYLNWDLGKPQTWQGVKWEQKDDVYRVTEFDLAQLAIAGELCLSNCIYLESVDCSYTKIRKIMLPNVPSELPRCVVRYCSELEWLQFGSNLESKHEIEDVDLQGAEQLSDKWNCTEKLKSIFY